MFSMYMYQDKFIAIEESDFDCYGPYRCNKVYIIVYIIISIWFIREHKLFDF